MNPPGPTPSQERGLRARSGIFTGCGWSALSAGGLSILLWIAMAITGPAREDVGKYTPLQWLGVCLVCIIVTSLPAIIAGIAFLVGARNAQLQLQSQPQATTPAATAEPVVPPQTDEASAAEMEIRSLLRKLPPLYRNQAAGLSEELNDLMRRQRELSERLVKLRGTVDRTSAAELDSHREQLEKEINAERDPVIRASLEQQMAAVEGQLEALRSVENTCARLEAAREASLQSLLHLRA